MPKSDGAEFVAEGVYSVLIGSERAVSSANRLETFCKHATQEAMSKTNRMIYLTSTGLLSVMLLLTIGNTIFNNALFTQKFSELGYPAYLIYPLVVVRILALVAIWSDKSRTLKEWAYAGVFFELVLATAAHVAVADGGFPIPLMGIVFLFSSYVIWRKTTESPA